MTAAAPDDVRETTSDPAWSAQTYIHTLAMLALTLIALYACLRMIEPFVSPLTWALTLAVLMMPLQRWLETKIASANLVAAICVLAAAAIVVVPVIAMTASMINEAVGYARNIQAQLDSGEWRALMAEHPRLARAAEWIEGQLDVAGSVTAASGFLTEVAGRIVKGSVRQVVELVATFYLLFYFLRDRRSALKTIQYLSPMSSSQMQRLYRRVGDTLHATIFGTLAIALVQGTLGGLMFWALDLPAPLLWGTVMGLLAIVPVLGAFVVWIPAALFLLLTGHPGQALLMTLWGAIVVGGIDNVLYPILVGNRLRMHTVMIFISIVGGLIVFGAAGLILGPVVLTTTIALLEAWRYPEAPVAEPLPHGPERIAKPGATL